MEEVADVDELMAESRALSVPAQPFEEFFAQEMDRLQRALVLITGSRSDAEDIAQESFMRVFARWDEVGAMEEPAGYLHRVAMNLFRSRYRRAVRELKRTTGMLERHDDGLGPVEDRDAAARVLSTLTPRQRAALVLTEAFGYTGEETAELLGVKASTVYALTHQARRALEGITGGIDA